MLLMLIGFGGAVLGTRAFLALTGYPQVGGGTLHISHALWGGLSLFVAALVPLLVVNRAALLGAALLAGIGTGLFIDEVGKFITADNDYFFPAAAPIAYAAFLIGVWLYVRARGYGSRAPGRNCTPRWNCSARPSTGGSANGTGPSCGGDSAPPQRVRTTTGCSRWPRRCWSWRSPVCCRRTSTGPDGSPGSRSPCGRGWRGR